MTTEAVIVIMFLLGVIGPLIWYLCYLAQRLHDKTIFYREQVLNEHRETNRLLGKMYIETKRGSDLSEKYNKAYHIH